jgi:hypothetical protein
MMRRISLFVGRASGGFALRISEILHIGGYSHPVYIPSERDPDSKANLKKGFFGPDISGTPLRVRKAPGLSSMGGGSFPPPCASLKLALRDGAALHQPLTCYGSRWSS